MQRAVRVQGKEGLKKKIMWKLNKMKDYQQKHTPTTQSTQTTAETSESHSQEGIPPETTPQLDDKLNEMIGEIKPDWVNNYEKYFNMNIEDRQYMTKKDRKIEDIVSNLGQQIRSWRR